MLRIAVREVRAHVVRFLMSLLAVTLGVTFVAGTFMLRGMLADTFTGIVENQAVADAYVSAPSRTTSLESLDAGVGAGLPLDRRAELEAVDGVRAVLPEITGTAIVIGADGTAVLNSMAPTLAAAIVPGDPIYSIVDGRLPSGPDEVVLVTETLVSSGHAVGDTMRAVLGGEIAEVTIVGEASGGGALAGATMTLFDEASAEQLFAPTGEVAGFAVLADEGLTEQQLVDRLAPVAAGWGTGAGGAATVRTGDDLRAELSEEVRGVVGVIETFLLIFAAVALFVGGFIIANTFQMQVRQRARELALLRAMGASPLQVFASVTVQALLVGLVGGALGVAGGYGMVAVIRVVFEGMGMDLGTSSGLDATTVVTSLLVGAVVSTLAAALPARRAALVPPVEAMRDEPSTGERTLRRRGVVGGALVALGAALLGLVAVGTGRWDAVTGSRDLLYGAAAAALVAGALVVSPVLLRPVLRVLARPLRRPLRPIGTLAEGNVVRNPRRTASTAGALMIGMTLVAGASVIASSMESSVSDIVAEEASADLIIRSATMAVPLTAVTDLEALDEVGAVDVDLYTTATADVGGEPVDVTLIGAPVASYERSMHLPVVAGSTATIGTGQVAVQEYFADAHGLTVGDSLTLTRAGGTVTATIGAIVRSNAFGVAVFTDVETYDALVPSQERVADVLFVHGADGVTTAQLDTAVTGVAAEYVILTVMTSEEFASSIAAQVQQILAIIYALLALSIAIAVLGIVNTLALSLIERTREVGLLRAVGLGRLQLSATVTVESVLTAVYGTVVGVVLGVGVTAVLPTIYREEGLTELVVPWVSLGGMLALAVVVGVLASLWPGVRAARLPVLRAIAYE